MQDFVLSKLITQLSTQLGCEKRTLLGGILGGNKYRKLSKRVKITAKEEIKKHEARRDDSDSVSGYISNVNSMDYRPDQRIVQKMLQEESESFSRAKTYTAVPRPLYHEVNST